jgi:sulfur carrier protein
MMTDRSQAHVSDLDEIRVRINGTERFVPGGLSVSQLLEHLELVPATIVVELNREILERSDYEETDVKEGDRLELVHFVGGG